MHGLLNRAIQCFLGDAYGLAVWVDVAGRAGIGPDGFEPLLSYDDRTTILLIEAAAAVLRRPRETVLEDLGTYLVSHPNREGLRRLLRFGGTGFVEFLHSLDDLPDRARLALADLDLPDLELAEEGQQRFRLRCRSPVAGTGHVMVGLLRAMADDYGALAVLEALGDGAGGGEEVVGIHLLESRFAEGRRFDLVDQV